MPQRLPANFSKTARGRGVRPRIAASRDIVAPYKKPTVPAGRSPVIASGCLILESVSRRRLPRKVVNLSIRLAIRIVNLSYKKRVSLPRTHERVRHQLQTHCLRWRFNFAASRCYPEPSVFKSSRQKLSRSTVAGPSSSHFEDDDGVIPTAVNNDSL
jgi:hypothetical protein